VDTDKNLLENAAPKIAQCLTDTIEMFELFFDNNLVQKYVNQSNCCAQQFNDSKFNVFSIMLKVYVWQYMTKEEIYTVPALFKLVGVVQKPSVTPILINQLVVRPPMIDKINQNTTSMSINFIFEV
jgi:hypothetical protein